MPLKKIDITAGNTGGVAAFDAQKMRAAGVDDATLSEILAKTLGHFARLLTDGCGVGITIKDGQAKVFGIEDPETALEGASNALQEP